MWSRAVAAALNNWVLVLLFHVLFFHSGSWVPAHSPNLKRERESEKELLKCSTFPESLFAKEYFHCQYNLMAFAAQGVVYCKFMQRVEFFTRRPAHPYCGGQRPQKWTQEQGKWPSERSDCSKDAAHRSVQEMSGLQSGTRSQQLLSILLWEA